MLSTPEQFEEVELDIVDPSTGVVKIESSEKKSSKSNNLNNLVTKADLQLPFNYPTTQKQE